VTFRFPPGQLSVGLNDELDRFLQALARLVKRVLLHVAARQLLDVPDPPVAHLLEHSGVAILHSRILTRQLAGNQGLSRLFAVEPTTGLANTTLGHTNTSGEHQG
jgi:hypothetical protein